MNKPPKAFLTTALGITCVVWAENAGKARTIVYRSANDGNFQVGYPGIKVVRAPGFDGMYTERFKDKALDPNDVVFEMSQAG